MKIHLDLTYHAAQEHMFFGSEGYRYRLFPKGRRLGATQGAAQACIEYCAEGKWPILWGDTITANIQRYVERYFLPPLRKYKVPHVWRKSLNQLEILGGYIDFRGADRPENWEGFGYRRILLNEAGIILKDRSLFENSVMPMLLDYEDAQLVAFGTPKGSDGVFKELWDKAQRGEPGYTGKRYPTHFNPFLRAEDIAELEAQFSTESARAQEIEGHFVSGAGDAVIPHSIVSAAQKRWADASMEGPLHIGVDVAWKGDDMSVLFPRRGNKALEPVAMKGQDPVQVAGATIQLAKKLRYEGERPVVKVDVIGIGAGVFSILERSPAVDARAINVAEKPHGPENQQRYNNLRAQLWFATRDWLADGGAIPNIGALEGELTAPTFDYDSRGRYKVSDKEAIKKAIGRSTDYADALALSIYSPPVIRAVSYI